MIYKICHKIFMTQNVYDLQNMTQDVYDPKCI